MFQIMPLVFAFTIILHINGLNAITDNELEISKLSYITLNELELYRQSLNLIKDAACQRDLNATLWGVLSGHHWATSSKFFFSQFLSFLFL